MHWFDKLDFNRKPSVDLSLSAYAQSQVVRRPIDVPEVLENVARRMKRHAYPRRDLFAVTLALHEAVSNALRHGNRGDDTKCVHINYLVRPDEVLIRVEDEGAGFDADRVPNPYRPENYHQETGRGLMLIRAYSSWVCFDPPGNRVTFARRRTPS